MKESQLQAMIVSALRIKGYLVIHPQQNTSFGSFEQGRAIKNSHAMNAHLRKIGYMCGVPDLMVMGTESNGNHIRLFIECKSLTGTVSKNQKNMIQMLKAQKNEVRVVKDISQIQDLLDKDMINTESLLLELQIEEDRIKQENKMLKAKKKEDEKIAKALEKAEKKAQGKKIQKK